MRVLPRTLLLLSAVAALLTLAVGSADAVVVLFKDGYVVQGRITVAKTWFRDEVSGELFSVPVGGEPYCIQDGTRKIIFDPSQVTEVLKDKAPDLMSFTLYAPKRRGNPLPQSWDLAEEGPWNEHWERVVKVNAVSAATGPIVLNLPQRLTMLTPKLARVDALQGVDWVPYYLTREFDPKTVRTLLHQYYTKKNEPAVDRQVNIARFMLQAGWPDFAKRELEELLSRNPEAKTRAQDLLDSLKKIESADLLASLETAQRTGRRDEAANAIASFYKEKELTAALNDKEKLRIQEIKNQVDESQQQMEQTREFLKKVPSRIALARRAEYAEAAETILKELTPDTLPRLETFRGLAPQQLNASLKPNESAESVLAFALSGWAVGSGAAEGNAPAAWKLWQARQHLLEYQKGQTAALRAKALNDLKSLGIAPDVAARMIPLLPPPDPCDKLNGNAIELQSDAPEQLRAVSYLVQVPPEYNHQRHYPVLIVLHRGDEKPADMLRRWSDLAAKNGYILVAPSWGGGAYGYSEREHAAVLDCLRDLRRRFQVDSDRVFLFGADAGGTMAYDVGLAHPDQFAGVAVMSAYPNYFAYEYKTNAQYLPFYVIDGERNGTSPLTNRAQFKRWVQWHYPSFYVEYRGRGGEWFGAELPNVIDWMNRKKRHHPNRQIGREGGEEFCTMRQTDNYFYCLSTDSVSQRYLNDVQAWRNNPAPAKMACTISTANQIFLRVGGVDQLTVWLAPGMIDFAQKISVRLNGHLVGGVPSIVQPNLETMLEKFYYTGDRQRLFLAKIDLRLQGG